jgi:hypothetical protein
MARTFFLFLFIAGLIVLPVAGRAQDRKKQDAEAREIFKQLIEINTSESAGRVYQSV